MRELRLKYIIQMVSDIGAKAKTDAQALTMAQKMVDDALKKTGTEASAVERVLLRLGGVAGKSAQDQAVYLSKLAMRYQDVRKAAEGAANAMTTVAKVGAGAAAAGYAADRMTRAPMEYSLRLAHMANTAYADRDAAGRIAGKQTLNAAITAAIRTGGGKRDDAASALDTLIASGAVSIEDSVKLLPMLMKASTASGATAEQLGSIALRGMQSFGIKRDQVPDVLNMAMAAGQAGGFELRDMAKWLPQAMALGKNSGLGGVEGLRRIIASMQASVITAGTKDEAGNNVVNLLGKVNSVDTAKDFKKATGIDLTAHLAAQREKGVNALDAFVGLVDGVASADPEYMALKKKLAAAGSQGERAETLQSMTDILQGKAIGTVIQDRQAMMALVAEMNNREYVQRVLKETRENKNALGTSFDVINAEPELARQRAFNEASIATQNAFEKVAPAVNAMYDGASGLAREFPGLTTGVALATGALAIFTAALGASGLIGLLTGRAGNAGGMIGTAATMTAGTIASGLAAPFRMSNAGKWVRQLSGTFGPMLGFGIDAWGVAHDDTLTDAGKRRGYAGAAAGGVGGWGGALGGAALGTMLLPGIGTAVGGLLGGIGGYMAGKGALQWLWGQDPSRDLVRGEGAPGIGGNRIELGQGKVEVEVRLTDNRASVSSTVLEQPSFLTLSSGNTNPAGYTR